MTTADPAVNVLNYIEQGGARTVIGGEIDIVTGGKLKINGSDVTAGVGGANVGGVASGYLIARSAAPVALDGSNPTSVAHGLGTCVAAFVQLVGSAAPGDSTSVLTCVINGANIDVYGWKNTGGTDPTLVASTGTETFNWFAVGTA
jgi:hypothetical protein